MENQNVKFNYLYRDANNYKRYGEVIFKNHGRRTLNELEIRIRQLLSDQEFFEHWHLNIASLFFETFTIDDHN